MTKYWKWNPDDEKVAMKSSWEVWWEVWPPIKSRHHTTNSTDNRPRKLRSTKYTENAENTGNIQNLQEILNYSIYSPHHATNSTDQRHRKFRSTENTGNISNLQEIFKDWKFGLFPTTPETLQITDTENSEVLQILEISATYRK